MEDAGLIKLYEPCLIPSLRGSRLKHFGQIPPYPVVLAGNPTPTIPHLYSKRRDSGFPMGCANSAAVDGRRCSNVYEVNPWIWQFGRSKPRLCVLNVEETTLTSMA
jgi:hypothetical protein